MTKLGSSTLINAQLPPMLYRQKDPSKETAYEPEDTIFRTDESKRMQWPGENMETYEEVQTMNQVWLWVLMGIETFAVLLPLVLLKVTLWVIAPMALVMLLTLIMLGSMKLKTRIDEEGVDYQMNLFHWNKRAIPWSEIDQIYVRQYSPMREYGGWGMRYGRNGRAITMHGKYGIQIVKKDGKRILIGTEQPESVTRILQHHPLLV